jgi:hypothetical protein
VGSIRHCSFCYIYSKYKIFSLEKYYLKKYILYDNKAKYKMANNLITNGKFLSPLLPTNSFNYVTNFTPVQKQQYYWTPTDIALSIGNGTNAFGYPNPLSLGMVQYVCLQNDYKFQQSFTATQLGTHTLSFLYCARPLHTFNYIKIYLNGTFVGRLTTEPTNWSLYSSTLSPNLGTNTILFQGVAGEVGIGDIKLIYGGVAPTMANNLIQNGDFLLPVLQRNIYRYVNSLTTAQKEEYYWTPTNIAISIGNGTNAFGYPNPSSLGMVQYICLQGNYSFQQSFTATQLGTHTLSFLYCARPPYTFTFNYIKIYLNGTLFDQLTLSPNDWTLYSSTLSPNLGTNTILFQGVGGEAGIGNIKLIYTETSSYYYKAVPIDEILKNEPNDQHVTTNFKEPADGTDMGSKFGYRPNNLEILETPDVSGSKPLYVYTDLGYNYWNGSKYVNIALISQPKYNDYTDIINYPIAISVPTWCTKIYFILIGGGGGGNRLGSGYPGGGGEFVYGCVTKPAITTPANTIYCRVGYGGFYNSNYNPANTHGGETFLTYNNGVESIDIAKAYGGITPANLAPGNGGSGGYVNNGTSVLIKKGVTLTNSGNARNGMNRTEIELGTTLSEFNGKKVLHYDLQDSDYGKGGNGFQEGIQGLARIYFSP